MLIGSGSVISSCYVSALQTRIYQIRTRYWTIPRVLHDRSQTIGKNSPHMSSWYLPALDTSNRAWYAVQATTPITSNGGRPTAPSTASKALAATSPTGRLDVAACREDMKIIKTARTSLVTSQQLACGGEGCGTNRQYTSISITSCNNLIKGQRFWATPFVSKIFLKSILNVSKGDCSNARVSYAQVFFDLLRNLSLFQQGSTLWRQKEVRNVTALQDCFLQVLVVLFA